jgi:hypothetical protein
MEEVMDSLVTWTKLDSPFKDIGGLPIGDDHYLAENLNEYQFVFLDTGGYYCFGYS